APLALDPPAVAQPTDVGALDAQGAQPLGEEVTPSPLLDPPADGVDRVVERSRDKRRVVAHREARAVGRRVQPQFDRRRIPFGALDEAPQPIATRSREVDVDRAARRVDRAALQDPWQPQAVVAVEVRDADARDLRRRRAGGEELALHALTGVEHDELALPPQQVAVLVPRAASGHRRGAEHEQLVAHGATWPSALIVAASRTR